VVEAYVGKGMHILDVFIPVPYRIECRRAIVYLDTYKAALGTFLIPCIWIICNCQLVEFMAGAIN
jgi:hypothetical protein